MREQHMQARFSPDENAALADGTGPERLSARAYVENEDALADLRLVERKQRVDEPIEPPGKL